jgi:hypothetical protein
MAIASYEALQAEISRQAGGSSDSEFAEGIRTAIDMVETELNTRLRVPEMMVRSREEVNERWEALPVGFLELRAGWFIEGFDPALTEADDQIESGTDIPLRPATPERIAHYSRYRGNPKAICVVGGQYRIEPRTEGERYFVRLWYYQAVPAVSAASPDLTILTRYPNLYVYGALTHLESWLHGDTRMASWQARFVAEIEMANQAAQRTARMRSYAA